MTQKHTFTYIHVPLLPCEHQCSISTLSLFEHISISIQFSADWKIYTSLVFIVLFMIHDPYIFYSVLDICPTGVPITTCPAGPCNPGECFGAYRCQDEFCASCNTLYFDRAGNPLRSCIGKMYWKITQDFYLLWIYRSPDLLHQYQAVVIVPCMAVFHTVQHLHVYRMVTFI